MSRKITDEEIKKLKEWNQDPTHKYVSIEDYQDLLDWMSNVDDQNVKKIFEQDNLFDIK
jgi:hypothetical protein